MSVLALASPLIATAVAAVVLQWLLGAGRTRMALDLPNQRSLHTVAVPRSGGLAVMAGTLVALACLDLPERLPLMAALGVLVAISVVDDFRSLSAAVRFLVHFLVAGTFAIWLLPLHFGWAYTLICVPAVVWMTNLYNFMDGSDGLAGGMTAFGFGTLAVSAAWGGDQGLALLCAAIVGTALAFLRVNWHPARIFMGDSGSIPLGFAAAAIGLIGVVRGVWPWWLPVLAFATFIADASATLAQRALRGEKIWQAHRTHYYQRMVRMGLGHALTARLCYVAMAAGAVSALWVQHVCPQWGTALVLIWVVIYALLAAAVDRRWRHFESTMLARS